MRGKDSIHYYFAVYARITPAYAGKSANGGGAGGKNRDHPRVCGEKTKKSP